MKNLDREYKQQKKEYKKLARELKRKVRLVIMGQDYDENDADNESRSSDEDNEIMFEQAIWMKILSIIIMNQSI